MALKTLYGGTGKPVTFVNVKYTQSKKGDVLVRGHYLGSKVNQFGTLEHQFKSEDGETITTLKSAAKLNRIIKEQVVRGDWIEVTYGGRGQILSGERKGTPLNLFQIQTDPDRSKYAEVSDMADVPTDTEVEEAGDGNF